MAPASHKDRKHKNRLSANPDRKAKPQSVHDNQMSTTLDKKDGESNRLASRKLKNPNPSGNSENSAPETKTDPVTKNLELFAKEAQELKQDIIDALDRQLERGSVVSVEDPPEVTQLRNNILSISDSLSVVESSEQQENCCSDQNRHNSNIKTDPNPQSARPKEEQNEPSNKPELEACKCEPINRLSSDVNKKHDIIRDNQSLTSGLKVGDYTISNNDVIRQVESKEIASPNNEDKSSTSVEDSVYSGFEPLRAKLDSDSKYAALVSSLQKHFGEVPQLLEPICRRLVKLSEQNDHLRAELDRSQAENDRLHSVRQKLENLCRELQRANNSIRLESFEMIKQEQGKAKEQTAKIQSTLASVMKLFDENQQRNVSLRQENHELQVKLRALLEHCDNWEKSAETALWQRDIENRLIRTELAKANLVHSEDKETHLKEKKELLRILSMMQEQQHRIEGQEAKLRSDLSAYASKYDECQAVISKGMNKFQVESRRMLKELDKSKQDYKLLLTKYEFNTKRMSQLLEEKQKWDSSIALADRKIDALEKLCRALRANSADCNHHHQQQQQQQSQSQSPMQSPMQLQQERIATKSSKNDKMATKVEPPNQTSAPNSRPIALEERPLDDEGCSLGADEEQEDEEAKQLLLECHEQQNSSQNSLHKMSSEDEGSIELIAMSDCQ